MNNIGKFKIISIIIIIVIIIVIIIIIVVIVVITIIIICFVGIFGVWSGARVLPGFMTWTNGHFQQNTLGNQNFNFEFVGRPSGTHRRAH